MMAKSSFTAGLYILIMLFTVSFTGYAQQGGKTDTISRQQNLPGIVVTDRREIPFIQQKIGQAEIGQQAVRDIGDFLRKTPNVSGIRKGGTGIDPVLRGFRYSQLNVIIDKGIRVEGGCPNRMDPALSHIEMEDIDHLSLTKGPFVLRYGPALGGVISVNPLHPDTSGKFLHIKAVSAYESNWGGHRQSVNVNGGNSRFHYFLSGGYKNYGNYTDGHDSTIKSSFIKYNYAAGIGISPFKNHHLSLTYRGSHGRDVRYPALPMDERNDDTRMLSLDYQVVRLSPLVRNLDIKLYQTDVYHEMDNHKRLNYPMMNAVAKVDAVNTGFRAEASLVSGKSVLYAGADYENISKDGQRVMIMTMFMPPDTMITTKKTNLWYEAEINNLGLFGEWHASLGGTTFTASLRFDYNRGDSRDTLKIISEGISYFDKTGAGHACFSASAGLTRMLCRGMELCLSIGRGERAPNMTERYIKFLTVGYDNYDYLGDPLLKPEANHQADLTLTHEGKSLTYYVNGFYAFVTDYISAKKLPPSVATPKTAGALGVKQFYNADYAMFRGFEIGLNGRIYRSITASLSAAYTAASISSATRYIYEGTQVIASRIINNDPLPEMPPLEANLQLQYKFLKNKCTATAHWRFVAAQEFVAEAMDEPQTPGFGVFNASLSMKPAAFVTLVLGMNNLFDKYYYEHLNRKIVGSAARLSEPGRSFFTQALINL